MGCRCPAASVIVSGVTCTSLTVWATQGALHPRRASRAQTASGRKGITGLWRPEKEEWDQGNNSARRALQKPRRCASYIWFFWAQAQARLTTVGGSRRICVGRKRRWPSFIIWRWAGPAPGGWTLCRRSCPLRRPHLLSPPRRRPRPPAPRPRARPPRRPRNDPRAGRPRPVPRRPPRRPRDRPSSPRSVAPRRRPRRPPGAVAGRAAAGSGRRRSVPGLGPGQRRRAVDQRDVSEGLRKVAEELSGDRIDLLGVEAHVVRVAQHPPEYSCGALRLADHGQGLRQPEGTDREGALLPFQPIRVAIAVDQLPVGAGELARHRAHGALHPGVVPGEVAHHGNRERRRVEGVVVVRLGEGLVLLTPPAFHDLGVQGGARRLP